MRHRAGTHIDLAAIIEADLREAHRQVRNAPNTAARIGFRNLPIDGRSFSSERLAIHDQRLGEHTRERRAWRGRLGG